MRRTMNFLAAGMLAGLLTMGGTALQAQQEGGQRERSRPEEPTRQQRDEQGEQAARQGRQAERQRQRQNQTAERGQRDQQQRDQQQRDRQMRRRRGAAGQGNVTLDPKGWIRVATDYDLDGRFDAIETIYYFDLERARKSSRQRKAQARTRQQEPGRMARTRGSQRGMSQRGMSRGRGQTHRVTGTLQSIQQVRMAGEQQDHLVARIERQDGRTARVLLGAKSQVPQEKLRDADQITITGHTGSVNDRPVLVAARIEADGERIDIDNRLGRKLKRVKGEVASTRTARFRGHDTPFLIGRVTLKGGDETMVNFGPVDRIRDKIQLDEGTQVSLLVRPGRINGRDALIAEQINANDQTVTLPRPQDRQRFRGRSIAERQRQEREERAYRAREEREERREQPRREGQQGEQQREQRRPEAPERETQRDREQAQRDREQKGQQETAEDRPFTYDSRERVALGILVAESDEGLLVARVLEGSPAAEADLREGDEILAINGTDTGEYRDMLDALQQHDPQEEVEIRIRRDGETQTVNATLRSVRDVYQRSRNQR